MPTATMKEPGSELFAGKRSARTDDMKYPYDESPFKILDACFLLPHLYYGIIYMKNSGNSNGWKRVMTYRAFAIMTM